MPCHLPQQYNKASYWMDRCLEYLNTLGSNVITGIVIEVLFNWWKVIGFDIVAYFIVNWQIISNHELIKLKRFISC